MNHNPQRSGGRAPASDRPETTGTEGSSGYIEILGPWLLNKGDDLMLRAIVERLGSHHALAASSDLGQPRPDRRAPLPQIRWRPTRHEFREAIQSRSLAQGIGHIRRAAALTLLPPALLRRNGYVPGRAVTALLDCSGFAYGDQWSSRRPEKRSRYLGQLKERGCRLVMLPQALGPFSEPDVRSAARALLGRFDLVFARDASSHQYASELQLDQTEVRVAPDITHLIQPDPPEDAEAWATRVCVVPNARMIDKVPPAASRSYVDFLLRSVRGCWRSGLEPCLVLHESNDASLVETIARRLDAPIRVIDEDGLVTKGILGASYAVLSSRYHALVGALSQGTPALGTSWAHKYTALFDEYECPQCLISPELDAAELDATVHDFLEPGARRDLSEHLLRKARTQRDAVSDMWDRVEILLRGERPG